MIDPTGRVDKQRQKEKVRRRMHVTVDMDNYEYIPAKKVSSFYDNDAYQRVAVYVRVSTDDVRQTTSYELQQKYYEDYVSKHPNWELVGIYADEGISGTSLKHRDEFNRLIRDAKDGKIDIILTKSVSRFARNVVICIGVVRELAELKSPVGVFFESESIFSMNDDSQMALTFLASMAEEESHIRSRSMDSSLRMRLDNGIPLTPKLLGYMHDEDGNLIVNPDEAPTVKLMFFMYLYGYSSRQIAQALEKLGRQTYLGNWTWSSSTVLQVLRNERHCGDVLTQKTITENFRTHRTLKNRGEKPQSRYLYHHEGIVSRDDFIAVQHMIDNAKYRNQEMLPKIHVIDEGFLKGYVVINPRWAGFDGDAYVKASESVITPEAEEDSAKSADNTFTSEDGEFDLRGFEIVRTGLLDLRNGPTMRLESKQIKFSTTCAKKFGFKKAELLIHPQKKMIALRPAPEDSRNGIVISVLKGNGVEPRYVPCGAYGTTVFALLGWDPGKSFKITGTLYENGTEFAYIFDAKESEVMAGRYKHRGPRVSAPSEPKCYIRTVPENWADNFGENYYIHRRTFAQLENQSEEDWNLYLAGQLFNGGNQLKVTDFETIRSYIQQELKDIRLEDETDE